MPTSGLENWLIMQTFHNGLHYNTKMTIDAAAGGALMNKPYPEASALCYSPLSSEDISGIWDV